MGDDSWQQSDGRNVYQMFVDHGGPGFWIRRTTWGGTCARIVRVGEMTAAGPYFGRPTVLMDVYSLRGELKDEAAWLNTAGTYKTWRQIDPPPWASEVPLRPLDDPALDSILTKLDKKRPRGSTPERVWLKVPYERKDEAKALGARWAPAEKLWWVPAEREAAVAEAKRLGFVPEA